MLNSIFCPRLKPQEETVLSEIFFLHQQKFKGAKILTNKSSSIDRVTSTLGTLPSAVCTGCPTKHDNSWKIWKSIFILTAWVPSQNTQNVRDYKSSIKFIPVWSLPQSSTFFLSFICMILEKQLQNSGIFKMGYAFLCCQYYRRYWEFCSDLNFVK